MLPPDYRVQPGRESIFVVDPRPLKFGPGAVAELGGDARGLGMSRVAVFTDRVVAGLEPTARALDALDAAGLDVAVYDDVEVEPTDASFARAAEFLGASPFDGVVSIGGGSVMDTAKAANLYASHPAEFLAYVNKPFGEGRPVPGPVMPHIACPTTAGTGSEATGVTVFDLVAQKVKTGISSRHLKPSLAVIDPEFTYTLPPLVTAATAFDVLTHAIESYTAIPYTERPRPDSPAARPPYQGANPHSDSGSLEAIRLGGRYLLRAVADGEDREARVAMMYAATLAGSSFGNAGVHIPHAMSYSVAGMIRDYRPDGWPSGHVLCPHGISVVVNAPAAFRVTARVSPRRHLEVALALGVDLGPAATSGAAGGRLGDHGIDPDAAADAGRILADALVAMMRETGIPNGLGALGYGLDDVPALVAGASRQARLLAQAPRPISDADLDAMYRDAMRYW